MNKVTTNELRKLIKECRLYSQGHRPKNALLQVANSLESLLSSLDNKPSSIRNPLTKREIEVLELIALGYTNREIAMAFKLSEKTIEFHLSSVFKKTEASKRTEAITNAIKNQWLSPP